MTTPKILSIDDMKTNHQLIAASLEQEYETSIAMNGEEGIQKAINEKPDLILLDINMPGISGYETCERLKADKETENIPVVFVSDMNTLEDRMKGYDCGADDFISKPIQCDELHSKVKVLLNHQSNLNRLEEKLRKSSRTAMSAINSMGELGEIIGFMEDMFQCDNSNELSAAIFKVLHNYGLSGCVQYRILNHSEDFSSTGLIKPLEAELLVKAKKVDGIYSFGVRTLFNSDEVALLIKNMPIEDNDRYGRLKDHLAILLKGARSRAIHFKNMELLRRSKETKISSTLGELQEEIKSIDQRFKDFESHVKTVMEELLCEVEAELVCLSPSAEQEQRFLDLIDYTKRRLEENMDFGIMINSSFERMYQKIYEMNLQ